MGILRNFPKNIFSDTTADFETLIKFSDFKPVGEKSESKEDIISSSSIIS
ncbi:hypothetical protein GM3708_308 [Geminocystis sp. NIES-3708]|nr:hypothetical protein GM3708_308 [Geminocystis sp. NIES-3708]